MAQGVVHVFVAHAGTEKRQVVSVINLYFRDVLGLSVFVDEWSLQVGQDAPRRMLNECSNCKVGIAIVSQEFLRREAPMQELHTFLKRHDDPNDEMVLVPVLYDLTWAQFQAVCTEYSQGVWSGAAAKRPVPGLLQQYATDLQRLTRITSMRQDQWRDDGNLVRLLALETTRALEAMQGLRYRVTEAPETPPGRRSLPPNKIWLEGVANTSLSRPIAIMDNFIEGNPAQVVPTAWVFAENVTANVLVYPMNKWDESKCSTVEEALRTFWGVGRFTCCWVAYSVDGDSIEEVACGGTGLARQTCRYHGTRWLKKRVLRCQPVVRTSGWQD